MSSEEESSCNPPRQKRPKIERACDDCKRRKRRCEGRVSPQNKCSNCITLGLKCTYEKEPKKPGRPKGYMEGLERKITFLESLLKKVVPDSSALYTLVCPFDPDYAKSLSGCSSAPASPESIAPHPPTTSNDSTEDSKSSIPDLIHKVLSLSLRSEDDPFRDDANELDDDYNFISEQLKTLTVKRVNNRFWGKSSGVQFIKSAMSISDSRPGGNVPKMLMKKSGRGREQLFKSLPYREPTRPAVKYTFPPPDLIQTLSSAYFDHVNLFYPLLHRPTFERSITNNLHLHDQGFASVLLLVCACGSRYTDEIDLRTLEGDEDPHFLAGWKWYKQVQFVKPILVDPPTLCDLQLYCLAVEYLSRCSAPQTPWLLAGFGIRLAQDEGVHRRRVPLDKLTVEAELWKRAFWVLVARDRMMSVGIGRTCAIDDNQFDLDMPIECDDEYWEHPDPKLRFRQPKGKPSSVTAFNRILKLSKIMTFAMTTIYSIKTKFWTLIMQEWEQHIITELDSALNHWMQSLPEYLRWDPTRPNDKFYKLSGYLYTMHYLVQILIHRPYIHSTHLPFPSLSICTNAARTCTVALEQQLGRYKVIYSYMQFCGVTTGIVLLLNIWESMQKEGGGGGGGKDLKAVSLSRRHVEICIEVLRRAKERASCSEAVMNIFIDLANVGNSRPNEAAYAPADSAINIPEFAPNSTSTNENGLPTSSFSFGLPRSTDPYASPQLENHFCSTASQNMYDIWKNQNTAQTSHDVEIPISNGNQFNADHGAFHQSYLAPQLDAAAFVPHHSDIYPSNYEQQANLNINASAQPTNDAMTMWMNTSNYVETEWYTAFLANMHEFDNIVNNNDGSQWGTDASQNLFGAF